MTTTALAADAAKPTPPLSDLINAYASRNEADPIHRVLERLEAATVAVDHALHDAWVIGYMTAGQEAVDRATDQSGAPRQVARSPYAPALARARKRGFAV